MALKPKAYTLKRKIPDLGIQVSVACPPGMISVLRDDEGSLIEEYQNVVRSECSSVVGIFDPAGKPLPLSSRGLLGFDSTVEDHGSIGSFLLAGGFHEDECEKIIERYELRDQAYLPFRLLPPTAQRQMELILLMRASALPEGPKLLFLNDPFLPFSGRWREAFAELLLEHVRTTDVTAVVFHLSFKPKAWTEIREVREVEVLDIDQRAIQKHFAMKVEEESQKVQDMALKDRQTKSSQSSLESNGIKGDTSDLIDPSLGPLMKKSSGWGDSVALWLAGFSSSVRSGHGAVAFLAVAILVGAIGFVGYPQASRGWAKMKEIGAQQSINWASLFSAPNDETKVAVLDDEPEELSPVRENESLAADAGESLKDLWESELTETVDVALQGAEGPFVEKTTGTPPDPSESDHDSGVNLPGLGTFVAEASSSTMVSRVIPEILALSSNSDTQCVLRELPWCTSESGSYE